MKTTVLIVEDEPLLLMMAVDIVEDAGFQALEARNADEAIRVLEDVTDVAIMWTDIDMPGSMDGLMLAAAVRDRWPPIEIVVVSGMRKPEIGNSRNGASSTQSLMISGGSPRPCNGWRRSHQILFTIPMVPLTLRIANLTSSTTSFLLGCGPLP